MSLPAPLTSFTFNHSDQVDDLYDVLSSTQIKASYDSRSIDVNTKVTAIINALASVVSGDSGAKCIGVDSIYGDNVKEMLDYIIAQGSGSLPPDDSITFIKLATAVQTRITDLEASQVPLGGIIMYDGAFDDIPTSYALCDGTNGTPNLSDRFILATTTEDDIGDTGGNSSVTLSTSQLPSHTHTGTTDSSGSHYHTYNSHVTMSGSGYGMGTGNGTVFSSNTSTEPAHTHPFTTGSSGSGSSVDITNPYYKLAYIKRIV